MMEELKKMLQATNDQSEIRNIMCSFFYHNHPKLLDNQPVINYSIYNDRVEIDSSARFDMFTVEDVTNAVITEENTLSVPCPRRASKQIVTIKF